MSDKDKQKISAEESQKYLLELLALAENKLCADCGAKGPRWASANLGIFLCIKCSGLHRSLGTHISQVRSVSLDKWTPEHLRNMQNMGNARAAEIWEANVPDNYKRPNENDSYALEQWIRSKYDRKAFVKKDGKDTKPKTSTAPKSETHFNKTHSTDVSSHTKPPTKTQTNQQALTSPLRRSVDTARELISWDTPAPTNTLAHEDEFTEFSGFQSAASFAVHPPSSSAFGTTNVQSTQNNSKFDAESAFFSGQPVQVAASNAPAKPSKEAILSLYQAPVTSNPSHFQNQNQQQNYQQQNYQQQNYQHTGNYNIRMPGLGMNTTPTSNPYANTPMYGIPQQPNGMVNSNMMPNMTPTMANNMNASVGYVNPAAQSILMNNPPPSTSSISYVNPNYLKMMNGGPPTMNNLPTQQNQNNFLF